MNNSHEQIIKKFFDLSVEAIENEYKEIKGCLETHKHFQEVRDNSTWDFFYDEKAFIYIILRGLCRADFPAPIKGEENYMDITIYSDPDKKRPIAAIQVKACLRKRYIKTAIKKKGDSVETDVGKLKEFKDLSVRKFVMFIVGIENSESAKECIKEDVLKQLKDKDVFLDQDNFLSQDITMYNSEKYGDLTMAVALIEVNGKSHA